MKIQINNETYSIRWFYQYPKSLNSKMGIDVFDAQQYNKHLVTECYIEKYNKEKQEWELLVNSQIKKHSSDKFDKHVARFNAFKKAISHLSKEMRTKFWNHYNGLFLPKQITIKDVLNAYDEGYTDGKASIEELL